MGDKARIGQSILLCYEGGPIGEDPIDIATPDDPLRVVLGAGQIPVGLENALLEMEEGEERTVDIEPTEGFGLRDEKLCTWYPRMMIPRGAELGIGDRVNYTNEQLFEMVGLVTDAAEDAVLIDFNHPFAGKPLRYRVSFTHA